MVALVVFTILAEIAMPWLMLALAPGFAGDPAKFDLAVMLARIALPYLLCMALVALYSGVLNALGRFAIAALAPALLNVVLIAVLLALVVLGVSVQSRVGVALAWGVAVSGLLQVLVVGVAAARAGMRLSIKPPRLNDEISRLLVLAAPGAVAGGIAQLTAVIGTIIASLEDRVVSWLYYADRLFQLPLGIIGVAIGVVLLPDLSRKFRAGDHEGAIHSENRSLEFALLLTVPAAVALFLASDPIVRVLFERGAFTAIDAGATGQMLAALALGLPAYVLIKVFHPGFFAREDTKTPMIFAGWSMLTNVVLSLALFLTIGAVGIAIAATISGWFNLGLLVSALGRRGEFALDAIFRRRLPAILLAAAIMGGVVWANVSLLDPWFAPENGLIVQVLALLALVTSGLITYAVAAELLGAVSLKSVLRNLGGA